MTVKAVIVDLREELVHDYIIVCTGRHSARESEMGVAFHLKYSKQAGTLPQASTLWSIYEFLKFTSEL